MNKRFLGSASVICLAVIIAGCGGVVQSDLPASETVNETQVVQAVAPTAPAESTTTSGSSEVTTTEVDIAPVEEATIQEVEVEEDVTVSQIEPETDVIAEPRTSTSVEIPRFENELAEGEYGWSQLLSRDSIFPIYDPEFAPASQAPYDDNELVIGVAINGEARAYAIGPLNGREMVNDTVGGVPILVTW